jgi:hypothetical protein
MLHPAADPPLTEKLGRLRDIGREIARLTAEARDLRKEVAAAVGNPGAAAPAKRIFVDTSREPFHPFEMVVAEVRGTEDGKDATVTFEAFELPRHRAVGD